MQCSCFQPLWQRTRWYSRTKGWRGPTRHRGTGAAPQRNGKSFWILVGKSSKTTVPRTGSWQICLSLGCTVTLMTLTGRERSTRNFWKFGEKVTGCDSSKKLSENPRRWRDSNVRLGLWDHGADEYLVQGAYMEALITVLLFCPRWPCQAVIIGVIGGVVGGLAGGYFAVRALRGR